MSVASKQDVEAAGPAVLERRPSTPDAPSFTLRWENISFETKKNKKQRQQQKKEKKQSSCGQVEAAEGTNVLVHPVSGQIRSGELMAVMGPSGAGKSTLLDMLAGRRPLAPGGRVLLNGTDSFCMRRVSSYVEQDDALLSVLTVRETLEYTARLGLPGASRDEVRRRVDATLSGLGLAEVAQNRIGNAVMRGISGGQKRRVTLGNGLVTSPRILFLDEPTSGLDSATAHEVIQNLRRIARQDNVAVVASIHSPKYETFALFDRVCLLARGRTVYSGATSSVASYFASLGHPCPTFTNPADHMVSLVSSDFGEADADAAVGRGSHASDPSRLEKGLCAGDVQGWARAWSQSPLASPTTTTTTADAVVAVEPDVDLALPSTPGYGAASVARQTLLLTRRNLLNYRRNPLAFGVRAAMYVGMAVMMALAWLRLPLLESSVPDRLSAMFFSVAFLAFMSVAGVPTFLETRNVFMRERRNALYSPLPYALADTLSFAPFLVGCSLLFSLVVYWSMALHPGAAHFGRFFLFLTLAVLAGEAQTLLVASLVPLFVASLALAAAANGLLMVVGGFLVRSLPRWLYHSVSQVDYQRYSFMSLVRNELLGLELGCDLDAATRACACRTASPLAAGRCAVDGASVVDSLGYAGVDDAKSAALLVAIFAFYRFAFWIALVARK